MIVNCLIPARGGSKRIPRKNLIDFCGKPLMVWSIEQALAAKEIDKVYVSSEDAEILGVAKMAGSETVWRPDELAQDSSTLEDVIEHFLKEVPTDILVVLQPTSPLRLPGDIDNCINACAMSANIEDDLFLWKKVPDYYISPITFTEKTRLKESGYYRENGSIYVIYDCYKKPFSRYNELKGFYLMHKWQSYEIDGPEDVQVCEALMREFILK
jgi:N-acylneuraminate cytidylyltransferase